eukprot:m.122016 g.122016  ORF g.122016 m.122016 type:complete len:380 (+) comp14414_c0_seq8:284-1423(+)
MPFWKHYTKKGEGVVFTHDTANMVVAFSGDSRGWFDICDEIGEGTVLLTGALDRTRSMPEWVANALQEFSDVQEKQSTAVKLPKKLGPWTFIKKGNAYRIRYVNRPAVELNDSQVQVLYEAGFSFDMSPAAPSETSPSTRILAPQLPAPTFAGDAWMMKISTDGVVVQHRHSKMVTAFTPASDGWFDIEDEAGQATLYKDGRLERTSTGAFAQWIESSLKEIQQHPQLLKDVIREEAVGKWLFTRVGSHFYVFFSHGGRDKLAGEFLKDSFVEHYRGSAFDLVSGVASTPEQLTKEQQRSSAAHNKIDKVEPRSKLPSNANCLCGAGLKPFITPNTSYMCDDPKCNKPQQGLGAKLFACRVCNYELPNLLQKTRGCEIV